MTFFYNSQTGRWANESPPAPAYFLYETDLHAGLGWHAYRTQQEMLQDIKAHPGWPQPTNSTSQNLNNTGGVGGFAGSRIQAGAGDIYKGFNLGSIILRGGEIILGVVLVGVGVSKLTGADNIVTKAVKAVAP